MQKNSEDPKFPSKAPDVIFVPLSNKLKESFATTIGTDFYYLDCDCLNSCTMLENIFSMLLFLYIFFDMRPYKEKLISYGHKTCKKIQKNR